MQISAICQVWLKGSPIPRLKLNMQDVGDEIGVSLWREAALTNPNVGDWLRITHTRRPTTTAYSFKLNTSAYSTVTVSQIFKTGSAPWVLPYCLSSFSRHCDVTDHMNVHMSDCTLASAHYIHTSILIVLDNHTLTTSTPHPRHNHAPTHSHASDRFTHSTASPLSTP